MKTLHKLREKLHNPRRAALARYRRAVGLLADAKKLRPPDESSLTEAMATLGIGPAELESDLAALKQHKELANLARSDDPEAIAEQARQARKGAEERRTEARLLEQRGLELDGRLRGVVARRGELRSLEVQHPRLFADAVEVALSTPPKPEESERPLGRPEHGSQEQRLIAQHLERGSLPLPTGGAA